MQPTGVIHFRFWQRGGGYDRNITTHEEIVEKINDMHNNPVTRQLCDTPLDWIWSSARRYSGDPTGPLPVEIADI